MSDVSNLRVALVIQHYPPYVAGAELQASLLARLLGTELGTCEVVTTRFRGELPRAAEEGPVRVRRLPAWRFGRGRRAANFAAAFVYFLLHGHRYDIVHTFCLSAFTLGAIVAARLRGVRAIARPCTTGANGEVAALQRSFARRWLWRLFQRADVFVVQTPALSPELRAAGVPADRITCVRNVLRIGLDEEPDAASRSMARARLGLPDRPTVLFVGRLVEAKGIHVLREAWSRLPHDTGASLVIVGDGPEAPALRRWALEGRNGSLVHLAGQRADPESFYRAADIFAFPSREEAFGNALAEAMAFGLVVISSPVGLARELIRHGRNGLLVEGHAAGPLAAALAAMLHDAEARERLGRAARQTALQHFTPDFVVRSTVELYRRARRMPK